MIRCITLFLFSLLFINGLFAQSNFPASWAGVWQGDLYIYNKPTDPVKITMQLHIQATDSSNTWQWKIVYLLKDKSPDVRKYLLTTQDTTKGSYAIGELNGIVINAKYLGNTLITRFAVSNSLLLIKYSFNKESIDFEVISGREDNKTETGNIPTTNVPPVFVYSIGNYQKATLTKIQ